MKKLLIVVSALNISVGAACMNHEVFTAQHLNTRSKIENTTSSFKYVGGSSYLDKVYDDKNIYMYTYLNLYRSNFTNKSALYIANVGVYLTPGYVAYLNGHTTYNYFSTLNSGYIHVGLIEEYDPDNQLETSGISFKQAYPSSTATTTSFSTAFGSSYTYDSNFETGFDFVDGLSFKTESGSQINVSNSSSLAINNSEPFYSAQPSNKLPYEDNNFSISEFEWNYQYATSGKATLHYDMYLIFEVNSYSHYLNANDECFRVRISIQSCQNTFSPRYTTVNVKKTYEYGFNN